MKVREIITAAAWQDGIGYSYESTIENHIIEISGIPAEMDWTWLETDELSDGEDILYTVKWYAVDDDDLSAPVAEYKTWASELVE